MALGVSEWRLIYRIISSLAAYCVLTASDSLRPITSRSETATAAEKLIIDLTTCPVCLNLFEAPKLLPCHHAFCLKCLQGCFRDKFPGDEVRCPTCRNAFRIPSIGLDGLWQHFFVQSLIDFRKDSSEKFDKMPCEVCSESEDDSDKVPRTV